MTADAASVPIACNPAALTDRKRYQALSSLLRAAISGREDSPDGFTYLLLGERIGIAEVGEWIGLERQCCPFLNFALSAAAGEAAWTLALTGPEGTKTVLEREFPTPVSNRRD